MSQRAFNYLLAAALAALLSTSYLLDGPSLVQEQIDQAQAKADAIEAAMQEDRYGAAIRKLCGDNSAWVQLADSVQCKNKHGRNTTRGTL